MKQRAYAKINLCLDVVCRREDGYHGAGNDHGSGKSLRYAEFRVLRTSRLKSNVPYLPLDRRNTIVKADRSRCARSMAFKENFEITLQKHIPTQAGMAGGSTDGRHDPGAEQDAAVGNGQRQDGGNRQEKSERTFRFVCDQPAFVTGIGENLEHFRVHTPFYLLLVKPYKGVSTKVAFETLDFSRAEHPDCRRMRQALISNDYEGVIQSLGNTLEQSAFKLVPQIAKIKEELLALGFDGAFDVGQRVHGVRSGRVIRAVGKGRVGDAEESGVYPQNRARPQEDFLRKVPQS